MEQKYNFIEKTRLTLHHYLKEISWDPGHNDVTTDEMLEAFVGLMQAAGYDRQGIIASMREFLEYEDEENNNTIKE